jgi:hypothetical protein
MTTFIRMITCLGTTLRHTALFRTQLGELSHALLQSRARFHCKTLTGVLELGRLGFCPGFPQARRLGEAGSKTSLCSISGGDGQTGKIAHHRGRRGTQRYGLQNEAEITQGRDSTTKDSQSGLNAIQDHYCRTEHPSYEGPQHYAEREPPQNA